MKRTEWVPLIPRSDVGLYGSETEKIFPKIKQYLQGSIYDIGCGLNKVVPQAVGVENRPLPGVDIICENFKELTHLFNTADVVYSSHCLEHIVDDYAALMEWWSLLKTGGHLILYLPDGRYYNNYENIDHKRDYNYETFMMFFERAFCGMGTISEVYFNIIESGLDVGEDKYSFYLVAQKV